MAGRDRLVAAMAVLLFLGSLYFFSVGLRLMTAEPPKVAASLLAALIGISMLASSVSLLRAWVLARAVESERE